MYNHYPYKWMLATIATIGYYANYHVSKPLISKDITKSDSSVAATVYSLYIWSYKYTTSVRVYKYTTNYITQRGNNSYCSLIYLAVQKYGI